MIRVDDRWVRWLLAPAIVFISQATNDAYLVDFWHHLARGEEMTRSGQLLDHDIFTYTVSGRTFIDVNWLTQLSYYQFYSLGGLGLTRTINALFLAGAWAWLVGICKRLSGSLEIAMTMGILTFLGCWQVLTIRPQTYSIVLFIALFDVLLRAEKDPRWLWATPAFLALWANLHGAFPAGLLLMGAFWAGRVMAWCWPAPCGTIGIGWRGLAIWTIALIACTAATLVNPYGVQIYEYARATSGIAARRGIDEWLPPSWDQGVGVAWFLSLPVVFGVLAWSRQLSWRELALLIVFGVMAVGSIRMAPWWFFVTAPMIAMRLADIWPQSREVTYSPSRGALLTVLGLLAFCVVSLPPLHAFNPLLMMREPNETMANLESAYQRIAAESPGGKIFTKHEWGEYLGWRGRPDWKINLDGRIELYPDEVWEPYANISTGQSAEIPEADFLVLDADLHRRTGLLALIEANESFERIGEDGMVITFQRIR